MNQLRHAGEDYNTRVAVTDGLDLIKQIPGPLQQGPQAFKLGMKCTRRRQWYCPKLGMMLTPGIQSRPISWLRHFTEADLTDQNDLIAMRHSGILELSMDLDRHPTFTG